MCPRQHMLKRGPIRSRSAWLRQSLLSRLEIRWDHAADGSDAYGGTPVPGSTAPVPGTRQNSLILLADFTYKF